MSTRTAKRFWGNVDVGSRDECWNWKLSTYPNGYGQTRFRNRKKIGSHKLAYILSKGKVPEGMYVLHRCDNRLCCNPFHLFIGTQSDNVQDALQKGRWNAARGERAGPSKLQPRDVKQIRELCDCGLFSLRAVARAFKITHEAVRKIRKRESWAHI